MTAQPGSREWIARLIRTERLKAQRASPVAIIYSMDSPAENADLATADTILAAMPHAEAER